MHDAEQTIGQVVSGLPHHTPTVASFVPAPYGSSVWLKEETEILYRERLFVTKVLDTVAALVAVFDPHGCIVRFNRTCESITGYTQTEVNGQYFWELFILPEERETRQRSFREHVAAGVTWSHENIWLTKTGQQRLIAWSNGVMTDENGQTIFVISTGIDITDRKHLETQILQAHKMEAIGTLAGGVAHDFNNILAAILGYTELVLYDVPRQSRAWENLHEVLAAAQRATALVQQILTFSRSTAQDRQLIQLTPIVAEVLRLLRASLPSTIAIQQRYSAHNAMILGDATQIHQVLMNLGSNAAYAMRDIMDGRLEIAVDEVQVDAGFAGQHPELQAAPHLRLTVHDTGHGMPPEVMEHIFEPFFTTKGPGEGTGMGLAMVHGIITAHQGLITVTSAPGQGTTFTIYLPSIVGTVSPVSSSPESIVSGTGRILFVDDEEALTRWGCTALQRMGYTVRTSTNSVEALAIFQEAPDDIDLVITDQTMPHMTGEKLAQALRAIRPTLPIILCTGFSHTMNEDKALALGVNAFCMKPLTVHALGTVVQHVLAPQRGAKATAPTPC